MRIVHTGDWHLGKSLEGHSRLDEQEMFLNFFSKQCIDLKPDIILIAGDIYDTPNPPARAEKLFYDTLKKLSRDGECISVVIAGNHDNPERIVSAWPIAAEHGIIMAGTPRTLIPTGKYGKHRVVNSGEGFFELEVNGESVVVIAAAYPSEKRLNEVFYNESDDEEKRQYSYVQKIDKLFRKLETNFKKDSINITLSHLFTLGSKPSGSERLSCLGTSFLIGTDILPRGADYTALGHIHKAQAVDKTGRIRYCGAPIHYSKSEAAFENLFYCIDINKKTKLTKGIKTDNSKEDNLKHRYNEFNVQPVKIPVFKPIHIWNVESIDEAIDMCRKYSDKESWVYLEIKCNSYIREDQIKEMKSFKKDIVEIRPVIEADEKKRTVEMAGLSFKEQFIEFYKMQHGNTPDDEMVEMLMSINEEEYETD